MTKPTLLLDCDGVLCDHTDQLLAGVNDRFGTSFRYDHVEDFHYRIMTKEQRDHMYAQWHSSDLYDDDHLTSEQLDVLDGLRESFRVIACSSPMQGHIASKYRYLTRYFDRSDIILASDKSVIEADLLIDDAIHNLEAFPGAVICYDRPWNSEWRGPRARSFEDLGPLTMDFLIEAGYESF